MIREKRVSGEDLPGEGGDRPEGGRGRVGRLGAQIGGFWWKTERREKSQWRMCDEGEESQWRNLSEDGERRSRYVKGTWSRKTSGRPDRGILGEERQKREESVENV